MKTVRRSVIPTALLGVFLLLSDLQAATPDSSPEFDVSLPVPIVQFKVKVMGVLDVTGGFQDVRGHIAQSGTQGDLSANIAVDVKSVNTEDPARDHFLRSAAFFDAERFPEIRFEGVRVAMDETGKPQLVGDLTLHGKSRRVAFDVIRFRGSKCKRPADPKCYAARVTISRSQFGLDGFRMIASDEVEITVYIADGVMGLLATRVGLCEQCDTRFSDSAFESDPLVRTSELSLP